MKRLWNIFSFLLILISLIKCHSQSDSNKELSKSNLNNDVQESIQIDLEYPRTGDIYIGLEKFFYFDTSFNDTETNYFDSSDIEEKTSFTTRIIYSYSFIEYHSTSCRLFKPKKDTLKLLCKITDDIIRGNAAINIENSYTNYKTYSINIYAPSHRFSLTFPKIPIPFLYADEQSIQIEEDKESYELKFKIEEYTNEDLYLYSNDAYLYLNKCTKNEKNLICEVEKEDIEGILLYNNQIFDLYYVNSGLGLRRGDLIYNITIKDEIKEKQDINVKITRLLQEYINYRSFIAYETNVKIIPNLFSGKFPFQRGKDSSTCYFKKDKDFPMLLLCNGGFHSEGNILGNITNEIVITNCSIKYNFIIQPVNNNENFYVSDRGIDALYSHTYTKVLDFNSDEKFGITYLKKKDEIYRIPPALRLFPDLDDLDCDISGHKYNCYVNRSYFENKKSDYYYTYRLINYNDYNVYSIFYEFSPIKVIIPEDNNIYIKIKKPEKNITIGLNGTIFFKTNFNNNDIKIFNDSDIEDITFDAKINDIDYIYYDANCELLKLADNYLGIFCHLNQSLLHENQQIILKEAKFNYMEYTIIVFSNSYTFAEQVNYTIPLLLSENQTIEINEKNNEYNLIFKVGAYHNEDLFLDGILNIFLKLDNCNIYKKTMNCSISKEKLEEILIFDGDQFKVMAINDEFGTIQLDYVGLVTLNYNFTEKEDIFIGINKILINATENGIPHAFETNITSIQNLNSYNFEDIGGYCYFRKTIINPLFLICVYQYGYGNNKKYIKEEQVLDKIHYKYNFRIQPYSITANITVYEQGTGINSTNKEELNFISQNIDTIKFIVKNPLYINNIALIYNENSPSNLKILNCLYLNEIIKCEVPLFHFMKQNYKDKNYVQVYHSYQKQSLKIDYGIPPIKVTLPEKIAGISIDIKENYEIKIICQNARLYLLTNYDSDDIFNSSYSDESTSFKTTITTSEQYNYTIYQIICKLWKPKESNIIIICESDEDFISDKESEFQGYFNETMFNFNDYLIVITPDILLTFKIKKDICPFLYADKQLINVNENDQLYSLNFKIDAYNNESLLLSNMDMNYINLNCSKENKNLICTLNKEKILEQNNMDIFKVYYFSEEYGFSELDLIFGVVINSNIQKENIYVNILSLLQKYIDYNNYAPYETNVTEISNLITNNFSITTNIELNCFFKKSELNSLLILCNIKDMDEFSLGKIEQEIILYNIHMKYNFIILPVENTEIVSIDTLGSKALFVYPQFIDLYLNDFDNIFITMNFPQNTKKIMLNSVPLECSTSHSSATPLFKKCKVNKKDFKNYNGTQKLYIQHTNNDSPLIFYELSPIEIKLPQLDEIILKINKENNNKLTKIGKNGVLFFLTDYQDSENLFDSEDIENKTIFNSNVTDENENKYNVTCRLWKARNYNNTINIICNLNDDLIYQKQNIKLIDIIFKYKNYSINIISNTYIEVIQVNYSLSFLYSDKQNNSINYLDYKNYTYFTFMIEPYNNDILFLYNKQDNYVILNDCVENTNKTLTCKIETIELEEIIIDNIEYLSVGAINDNYGIYKINSILPIEINSFIPQKTNIQISLKTQLSTNGIVGIPFGLETNAAHYSNLITKKFNNYCYFKKVNGMNITYLCNVDNEQTYTIESNKAQTIIEDIHWKYDFVIKPIETNYDFYIKGNGSDIKALYPNIFDFSKNDNFIIRFIIPNPFLSKNITLNKDSSILECNDLEELKICNISYKYFKGKQSGYYYPYYLNENESFIFSSPPIKVNLSKIIEIYIEDFGNPSVQYMGKDNIIYLVTQYIDKLNIFNTSTSFNLKFSNNKNDKIIDSVCKVWNPINDFIRLICKLNERFENEEQIIYLNEDKFIYNNYKIMFYNNAKNIIVKQVNSEIAFLYSLEQKIIIDDNIDSYTLNFIKEIYNNEQLILCADKNKRIALNCNDETEEIKCNINKDDIFQILSYNEEKFFISQIVDKLGILPINSISDIIINYPKVNQTELRIYTLNLLTTNVDKNSFIAYETNIINKKRITTNFFYIERSSSNDKLKCQLKAIQEKLLLLCLANTPGTYSLYNFTTLYLYNSNILYSFVIYGSQNKAYYTVSNNEGPVIYSVYPEEIDFKEQDSFVIRYETDYPEKLNGIKLNNDSKFELECFNRIGIKECYVNETHFMESGDYYTYYQNSFGIKSISYETPKIKVILKGEHEPEEEETEKESEREKKEEKEEEDEKDEREEEESKTGPSDSDSDTTQPSKLSKAALIGIIIGSVVGGLVIIGLIIFLVFKFKKNKLENDPLLKENSGSDKIELMEKNNE